MFLQGNGQLAFSTIAGSSQTIADAIADQTGSGGSGPNAGSWSLNVNGTGTLILTGTNTFTGGTTIQAGATLQIASDAALGGGTLSLLGSANTSATLNVTANTTIARQVVMAGDPTFNIATGTTTTISGVIADGASAGELVLNADGASAGTLVLTAANTYTGATTINAGTLALSGSGSLGGSSAVTNNANFDITATSAPVQLVGTYAQSATGNLKISVSPSTVPGTGYSQLLVNGQATLGGALTIVPVAGTYEIGSKFDLVHAAGGSSGKFATVVATGSFGPYVAPVIVYQPNDVYLAMNPQPALMSSGKMYVTSRFAVNQSLFAAADAPLGGDALTIGGNGSPRQGFWMQALGSFGAANGANFQTGGVMVGQGYAITPDITAGFAMSSLFTSTQGSNGSVGDTEIGVTGYGIYRSGNWQLSVSETMGNLADNMHRSMLGETAKAGGNGLYNAAAARAQYESDFGAFFVTPMLELSYVHTQMGQVSEANGGQIAQTYAALTTDVGRLSGGVTGGMKLDRSFGMIEPWVSVGGFGSVGKTRYGNLETLQLATSMQYGNAAPRSAVIAGIGANVIGKGPWQVDAHWTGTWGDASTAHTVGLDVRYSW